MGIFDDFEGPSLSGSIFGYDDPGTRFGSSGLPTVAEIRAQEGFEDKPWDYKTGYFQEYVKQLMEESREKWGDEHDTPAIMDLMYENIPELTPEEHGFGSVAAGTARGSLTAWMSKGAFDYGALGIETGLKRKVEGAAAKRIEKHRAMTPGTKEFDLMVDSLKSMGLPDEAVVAFVEAATGEGRKVLGSKRLGEIDRAIVRGWDAGAQKMLGALFHSAEMDSLGELMLATAKRLEETNQVDKKTAKKLEKFKWKFLADADWWTNEAAEFLAIQAPLMATTFGAAGIIRLGAHPLGWSAKAATARAAAGTATKAAAAKAAATATTKEVMQKNTGLIAKLARGAHRHSYGVAGGTAGAGLEAAMEAGGTYQEVWDSTGDRVRAGNAASSVFVNNMAFLSISNALSFGMAGQALNKMPIGIKGSMQRFGLKRIVEGTKALPASGIAIGAGKLAGAAVLEGAEEGFFQEYYQTLGRQIGQGVTSTYFEPFWNPLLELTTAVTNREFSSDAQRRAFAGGLVGGVTMQGGATVFSEASEWLTGEQAKKEIEALRKESDLKAYQKELLDQIDAVDTEANRKTVQAIVDILDQLSAGAIGPEVAQDLIDQTLAPPAERFVPPAEEEVEQGIDIDEETGFVSRAPDITEERRVLAEGAEQAERQRLKNRFSGEGNLQKIEEYLAEFKSNIEAGLDVPSTLENEDKNSFSFGPAKVPVEPSAEETIAAAEEEVAPEAEVPAPPAAVEAKEVDAEGLVAVLAAGGKRAELHMGAEDPSQNYTNKDGVEVTIKDGGELFELNNREVAGDVEIDFMGMADSSKRNRGFVSKELDRILRELDSRDMSSTVVVDPLRATDKGAVKGLGEQGIIEWLERRGYIFEGTVGYRPKRSEDASQYKTKTAQVKQEDIPKILKDLELDMDAPAHTWHTHSSPQDFSESFTQGRLEKG